MLVLVAQIPSTYVSALKYRTRKQSITFRESTGANWIAVIKKINCRKSMRSLSISTHQPKLYSTHKPSPNITLEMLIPVAFQIKVVADWEALNGRNQLHIDFALAGKALGCGTKSLWKRRNLIGH